MATTKASEFLVRSGNEYFSAYAQPSGFLFPLDPALTTNARCDVSLEALSIAPLSDVDQATVAFPDPGGAGGFQFQEIGPGGFMMGRAISNPTDPNSGQIVLSTTRPFFTTFNPEVNVFFPPALYIPPLLILNCYVRAPYSLPAERTDKEYPLTGSIVATGVEQVVTHIPFYGRRFFGAYFAAPAGNTGPLTFTVRGATFGTGTPILIDVVTGGLVAVTANSIQLTFSNKPFHGLEIAVTGTAGDLFRVYLKTSDHAD